VYRKRISRIDAAARPGDWVAVYAEPDVLLGYGVYNPRSEIAVRILRFGAQLPDEPFWEETLATAVDLRRETLALDEVTNAYRVVHAEADGVSGMMIDRFGDVLSAEVFSLGMWQRAEEILRRCGRLCGTRHTIIQPAPQTLSQEGFDAAPKISEGAPREVTISEFGARFRVRFEGGHKTGFFCDQRDNRRLLAGFCKGKSVLDLCCYTGGFAVQAKRLGGAEEVIGVDLDEEPLKLARENAALNQVRVRFTQSDVFPFMRDMLRANRLFDVVVLDPPKLIRSRAELDEGTRKHFDLNRLAMQLVRPGGIFLSCTCSGLLDWEAFLKVLHSAARQAGNPLPAAEGEEFARRGPRAMQILAKTGAAMDHPIGSNAPETEYLRAVWMRMG
jgi:23S rRNA (cytosine1962-C5)-methyltransferase